MFFEDVFLVEDFCFPVNLPLHYLVNSLIYLIFHTDNSDRAFYKELVKVIEASDVILEVLDARDPLGTRCVDMERLLMKSGPNKHLVLLLNKIGILSLSLSLSLSQNPMEQILAAILSS
jgi:hypothetical protein